VIFDYSGSGPFDWHMVVQAVDANEASELVVGPARCVSFTISAPPGGRIDSKTLRDIPFGPLLEEALLLTAIAVDEHGQPLGKVVKSTVSLLEARRAHAAVVRAHRGRARKSKKAVPADHDSDLRLAASIYSANITDGKATKAVFDHFEAIGRPISRSTAGRWIGEARARGYLGPAPGRGVAGGARLNNNSEEA
jgi:hypothetical protein